MAFSPTRTWRCFTGLAVAAIVAALAAPGDVAAQDKFPSRPIELIVPFGPGGGADQLARLAAKLLEPELGVAVPVVNVPGGTGATGMAKLTAAPADGHTMAVYIADTHALLTGQNPRWKIDDIAAVAVMIKAPSFLFVAADSRFKQWSDLEAEAKAKPGTLKVATVGFGSVDDYTLKSLEAKGAKMLQVPFARPAERYVSILGGHADVLYEQAGDVGQFLASKQMRPLLVFGRERFAAFPDVPASHEVGYQVALPQFRSIVVRAGTPADRIARLSDALAKVSGSDEYKSFLRAQFADPASFIGADGGEAYLKAQLDEMKSLAGGR